MRRGKRADFAGQQLGQDRLRQRRALGRVGARAQFVEERERFFRHPAHDGNDIHHVRGERRKRLLDRLLVADIGENLIEYRKLRPQIGRHLQARHRHEREQADGFERNGFAARVRAGNDKRGKILPEPQIAGHHLFRGDQRMPAARDADISAIVHLRLHAAHLAGKARLGEEEIQLGKHVEVMREHLHLGRDAAGERLQNALDFRFFLRLELL